MLKNFTGVVLCLAIVVCSGCQSWMGGYPLQSPARVPPPGTGTYQVPSSYYNNTGGNVSQVQQGVPSQGGFVTANQGFPGTSAPVQPATYTTPANNNPAFNSGVPVGPNAVMQGSSSRVNTSISDSSPTTLDWQP